MSESYQNDFEKFLSHTNEKEVLYEEVYKEISRFSSHSLLDIGAGNGLLSTPLSRTVDSYVAVEQNPNFVQKLRSEGLTVIEGLFPIKVDGSFDLVLVSHALSYERDLHKSFVEHAWNLVRSGGILLIITYRGQEDDWTSLLQELGEEQMDYNRVGYNRIVEYLHSLGEVTMRKVLTSVRTHNLEDMIDALSFVFSDGKQERKTRFFSYRSKVEKILNSKYRDQKGFFFPFQHFFLIVKKM
ncbi:MAG: class I SAM-dependent methyltransferase [bacterium]|nr:class I SAM-dependent methyltransferase [bacterium]